MTGISIAAVLLRVTLGVTMLAHGWNHVWGGGKLPGTARWFASIGMRASRFQATVASVTELVAGALLLLGLLTPFACAAVVGTMVVALVANHIRNGFFIFRPGEGYEYVLMITIVAVALAALGGGEVSVDEAIGFGADGWAGVAIALALGGGMGASVLAAFWRPPARSRDGA
ncbi:MAG TPA: DoxX family protein [Acidimicrobiales bacterium]